MCVDSHLVFDWRPYLKDTGRNLEPDLTTPETSKKALLRLLGDLSINDRLKYSPAPEDVFDGCALRGAPYPDLRGMKKSECLEYYKLSKYVTNHQTCFRFQRNNRGLQHAYLSSVAFDPENPGIESSITLNLEVFKYVREFHVFFVPPGEKAIGELMTPKAFDRGTKFEYNKFGLRYRVVSSELSLSLILSLSR